ncbi:UNVERIFIED_CONTAM: hypothetical protein Slati_0389500 [Sesamum latifolium]|uniref:Uncharacterized protein n=1 Tax=Sesamum latifolium TaxID=2727402 RepID=A0AAW2XUJ1_9LAMI
MISRSQLTQIADQPTWRARDLRASSQRPGGLATSEPSTSDLAISRPASQQLATWRTRDLTICELGTSLHSIFIN